MSKYEALYLDYLVYFNRDRDYFECHEVLEELWLEQNKEPVYKGLLQVAVGMYHFRNQNIRGGYMMLESAVDILEKYPAQTLGIELELLVDTSRSLAKKLRSYDSQPISYQDFTIVICDDELDEAVRVRAQSIMPIIPQRRSPTRGRIYEERIKALGQNL
ncbi:DUF309 domain-containing protein [Paenibacillus urinalis]|uniref:DUF309 domain-containing protein n=1 Tax=Paenibacillus urinalis TaxID=521520 RepID=A0AAX3N411_9BACL|nr:MULTISPECIES: DUF309 domain-containing protein [Paenibacillus]WDH84357.1 DUF309 domain-containing protein [Paenibacillus urinalis]WDH95825.1 DUF309 domain-containing protein [Paenibacillus urinalis]WDI04041.1 DUF309 domain-containing protein [Paenibacillus urinalis]GAK38648.1 hypothetical protein TCA2_0374 [Paenibacillus sp. TCA20]